MNFFILIYVKVVFVFENVALRKILGSKGEHSEAGESCIVRSCMICTTWKILVQLGE